MTATPVCEHVHLDRATATYVIGTRRPGQVELRCPCCGLGAYAYPAGAMDRCPYCDVPAEIVPDDGIDLRVWLVAALIGLTLWAGVFWLIDWLFW